MARLILKRGAEQRVSAGHPWIYRTQAADLKGFSEAGLAVEVVDAGGRYLGQGFYNPRPSLCCRLLTRRDEAIDASFFRRRLEAAWEYRRTAGLVCGAYRRCWSEADGLPGLVVDRYGPVSVVQCLTLGMFKAAGWITAALARQVPDGGLHRLPEPPRGPPRRRGPGRRPASRASTPARIPPGRSWWSPRVTAASASPLARATRQASTSIRPGTAPS